MLRVRDMKELELTERLLGLVFGHVDRK